MPHTAEPWEIVELDSPTEDWTGSSFVIKSPEAPGGVAITIGGVGIEERSNAVLIKNAPSMAWLLLRIISELPDRRDWLDPTIEREARNILREISEA